MESDSETKSLIIHIDNKAYEDVKVTASARPFFKLLDGNVIFFWYKWLASIISTKVRAKKRKNVNEVTNMNFITYLFGKCGLKLYNITVVRPSDGYIAECSTPLCCTWVIEEKGIYQEENPTNHCKFKSMSNSLIGKRINCDSIV